MTSAIETEPNGHDVPPAREQAALRRVATLVAEGAPAAEVFTAVAHEVVQILGVDAVSFDRYEPDRTTTVVAALNAPAFAVGTRWPLDGPSLSIQVLETGRPARIDDYSDLPGTVAAGARDSGVRSAVGVPIIVDGGIWGMAWAGTASVEPLPAVTEERLRDFAELVAIAISNTESRDRLRRLADQQASLRRVATLVAEGATPAELFSAVAEEVARILDVSSVCVGRYESDGEFAVVASVNDPGFPVGSRWPVEGAGLIATVLETGRPARTDDYADPPGAVVAAARAPGSQSGVAAPIVVDGRVWGVIAVGRRQRHAALPLFTGSYTGRIVLSTESAQDTEARLSAFTELVATAISRAQAHDDLRSLAEEQAALRRVATLVAEAAAPVDIFAAVVDEIARLLELPRIELVRYETDGTATVIGAAGDHPFGVGTKWELTGPSVMASVLETSRSARIDDYSSLPGRIAEVARSAGFRSAIGAPIIVDGRTWGAIVAISTLSELIPERTDARLSQFTELVATAVSNATARTELISSRARIVTAGDEARRRFERDLHDGTQQRLLALRFDLQRIRAAIPEDQAVARSGLENAEQDLESVLEEVREFSRGIHPGHLAHGGLGPSLRALGRRSPIPVVVEVDVDERPPAPIETAVYYVVSEAITNAIKHSRASAISVKVVSDDLVLSRQDRRRRRRRSARRADARRLGSHRPERPRRSPRGTVRGGEPRRRRDHDLDQASARRATRAVSTPHVPRVQGVASEPEVEARSGLLDILLPVVYDLYFSGILSGAAEAAYEQDMRLVLSPTLHEHAREVSLLDRLMRGTSDGALLVLPEESSVELVEALNDRCPFVVIDPLLPLDARIPTVSVAHRSGASQAMRHLLELGHRRIAAITGPPAWVATEERRQGYRAALEAEGIPFDPELELEADFDFAPGAEAAARLLGLPEPPTAIFGFNDSIAIGALRAARERGLRVPDDLSILGFDDVRYAGIAVPPLTTVRQPLGEMGRTAVNLLIRLLERQRFETLHIELPTRLVVRESTAPPRAR